MSHARFNGTLWRIVAVVLTFGTIIAVTVAAHMKASTQIETNKDDIVDNFSAFTMHEADCAQAFRNINVNLHNLAIGQARIEERIKKLNGSQ